MSSISLTRLPAFNNVVVPTVALEQPGVIKKLAARLTGSLTIAPVFEGNRFYAQIRLATDAEVTIQLDLTKVLPANFNAPASISYTEYGQGEVEEVVADEDEDVSIIHLLDPEHSRDDLKDALTGALMGMDRSLLTAARKESGNKDISKVKEIVAALVDQFFEVIDEADAALTDDDDVEAEDDNYFGLAFHHASEQARSEGDFFLPHWLRDNEIEIEGVSNIFAANFASDEDETDSTDDTDEDAVVEVDVDLVADDYEDPRMVEITNDNELSSLSGTFAVDPTLNVVTYLLSHRNKISKEDRLSLSRSDAAYRDAISKLNGAESAVIDATISSVDAPVDDIADPLENLGAGIAARQEAQTDAVGSLSSGLRKTIEAHRDNIERIYASFPAITFNIPTTALITGAHAIDYSSIDSIEHALIQALLASASDNPSFNPVNRAPEGGSGVVLDLENAYDDAFLSEVNELMTREIGAAITENLIEI